MVQYLGWCREERRWKNLNFHQWNVVPDGGARCSTLGQCRSSATSLRCIGHPVVPSNTYYHFWDGRDSLLLERTTTAEHVGGGTVT